MLGLDNVIGRFPLGVWIAIVAVVLQLVAWGMQLFSLLNWDRAVDLGLQTERFTGDAAERALARADWGIVAADMLWPLPIAVVALIGLLRGKFFGFAAGLMEFSIGVYWPLVFAFQVWSTRRSGAISAVVIWTITSLLALLGLLANRAFFGV
jgi:hypothetical protein